MGTIHFPEEVLKATEGGYYFGTGSAGAAGRGSTLQ